MGCAASYAEQYADAAVVGAAAVAKLTRNVLLAGVVPLLSLKHAAASAAAGAGRGGAAAFSLKAVSTAVPPFVLGFVGAAAIRTLGDAQLASGSPALGLFERSRWEDGANWLGSTIGTKVSLGRWCAHASAATHS